MTLLSDAPDENKWHNESDIISYIKHVHLHDHCRRFLVARVGRLHRWHVHGANRRKSHEQQNRPN